ncbi:MAG TPA: DUF3499 family protein [Actinomycetota bacterium]|nr:DUF3499 family protein [Actinomycetota bacterium]
MNTCSKPGCANPGAAVLGYDYADRRATLEDPNGDVSPHAYVLCTRCAEKLTPPRGWVLDDLRSEPPLFLDRVKERQREEPAAIETLGPPEESRRQQLFFGYSA